MINRLALIAASAAAVVTLTVALAMAGFTPRPATPAELTSSTADPSVTDPAAAPTIQVDTVYLAPPVEPQTIVVRQNGGHDGEGEDDDEGGDDD